MLLPLLAATYLPCRAPAPRLGLFDLFAVQPSPADVYQPDLSAASPGLPASYDQMHRAAIEGVKAAINGAGYSVCEVDFPPVPGVNSRGDGSAKSEANVANANAAFVEKLVGELTRSGKVAVVGCGGACMRALSQLPSAVPLRDGASAAAGCDVAVCVAPADEAQWDAAAALGAGCVVIVNGLLNNGRHPHAYFYKPLTAFSAQTGACVRRWPGPYEIYASDGARLTLEVPLARQGRRALPDTKEAQMVLQNRFGTAQRP